MGVEPPKSDEPTLVHPDLPKAVGRLARNPLYLCLIAGMTFNFYLVGFFTFIPKYIQTYYIQTPAVASLVAGQYCTCTSLNQGTGDFTCNLRGIIVGDKSKTQCCS